MRAEVNAERERLGKSHIEDGDDDDNHEPPKAEKTVSTTDPDSGMFVKGEHERQFAYEAHTVCERHGFTLDVEVTAGIIHGSVAWDSSCFSHFRIQFALFNQRTAVFVS